MDCPYLDENQYFKINFFKKCLKGLLNRDNLVSFIMAR